MRISDDRECKPSMYTKCYYHVVIHFTLESTPYTVPQQAVIVTHDTHCVVLYNLYKDGVYLHHLRKRHVFRIPESEISETRIYRSDAN